METTLIRTIASQAFLLLQRLLPQHLLMSLVGSLAGIRLAPVKNFLIRTFVSVYEVDVTEVERPVPDGFVDFNDFFTRELAGDARPIDASADSIVSPVDGIMSAAGQIESDRLFQAKGLYYSLEDLLATDLHEAACYRNGSFATMYLAPYNYHRVHSPLAGELVAARYVPGHLFSVNRSTVDLLPQLFTRNERLVCQFRSAAGPVALIFVGALNVGSVSTPWTGRIRPRKTGVVADLALDPASTSLDVRKGQLVGWFNMGSTVILLLPPGRCTWRDGLVSGKTLQVGEPIGRVTVHAGS
ncbi:MAG: archaetidylserine decarboxylase [Woeseia sp.]